MITIIVLMLVGAVVCYKISEGDGTVTLIGVAFGFAMGLYISMMIGAYAPKKLEVVETIRLQSIILDGDEKYVLPDKEYERLHFWWTEEGIFHQTEINFELDEVEILFDAQDYPWVERFEEAFVKNWYDWFGLKSSVVKIFVFHLRNEGEIDEMLLYELIY